LAQLPPLPRPVRDRPNGSVIYGRLGKRARSIQASVVHNRTLDLGRADYYALAVFFPHSWKEPGDQARSFWGMAMAQFNFQLIYGSPVGLAAHRNHVNLTVQSGYFDGYATRWHSGNGIARGNLPRMYAIPPPLKLGSWHQLIVRVRWSTENDGAVDVWHRGSLRLCERRSPLICARSG
jgi:Polysaccharide lyase